MNLQYLAIINDTIPYRNLGGTYFVFESGLDFSGDFHEIIMFALHFEAIRD